VLIGETGLIGTRLGVGLPKLVPYKVKTLKEIWRNSVLTSCLVVGLIVGGSINILTSAEAMCAYSWEEDGKTCWLGLIGCECDPVTQEVYGNCDYGFHFCS